jgi:hypothetical protein
VTITGTGGGLTRTTTVALTVTAPPAGGGVTATGVVTSASPWFNEQGVRFDNTSPLTALTLTIVVQRTTGLSFSNMYNTVGGSILQTNASTSSTITYTYTLAAGQTIPAGTNRLFAAQTRGTGTAHPTAGDTWSMSYSTAAGNFSLSGGF